MFDQSYLSQDFVTIFISGGQCTGFEFGVEGKYDVFVCCCCCLSRASYFVSIF